MPYYYENSLNCDIVISSLTEVFCKKGALKHFAKFTGKHLDTRY